MYPSGEPEYGFARPVDADRVDVALCRAEDPYTGKTSASDVTMPGASQNADVSRSPSPSHGGDHQITPLGHAGGGSHRQSHRNKFNNFNSNIRTASKSPVIIHLGRGRSRSRYHGCTSDDSFDEPNRYAGSYQAQTHPSYDSNPHYGQPMRAAYHAAGHSPEGRDTRDMDPATGMAPAGSLTAGYPPTGPSHRQSLSAKRPSYEESDYVSQTHSVVTDQSSDDVLIIISILCFRMTKH